MAINKGKVIIQITASTLHLLQHNRDREDLLQCIGHWTFRVRTYEEGISRNNIYQLIYLSNHLIIAMEHEKMSQFKCSFSKTVVNALPSLAG